jgi:ribosomal RNA-processing protein 17
LREQRKQELEEHVKAMNAAMKKANGVESESEESEEEDEDEEWGGFDDAPVINHEDEYIDEDKYTTVTVEAVDISRDGFVSHDAGDESEEEVAVVKGGEEGEDQESKGEGEKKKRVWTKEKPAGDKTKKKKKKFRYESKSERKVTRSKEKAKNRAKAKLRKGG